MMSPRFARLFWHNLLLAAVLTLVSLSSAAVAKTVFLDERFATLDQWQPLTFPKIDRHSTYTIRPCDNTTCLQMESNNSASGLILKQTFNIYQYPILKWRWKVSNVYRKGDSATKKGDDYPARLYVVFAYDPTKAPAGKRLRYQLAKLIYGQFPPDSSISYIWDNRVTNKAFIINAYVDEARMIPVSSGTAQVNTWQEYTVDVVEDYKKAFGQEPPATASLAVMCDSDNTREAATALMQYIRIEGAR